MAKQSLDKLFQEKLKNHEIKPSSQAWEKLEFLLDGEDEAAPIPIARSRKKGVLWLSVAAALSLLVLSLAIWQMTRPSGTLPDMAKNGGKVNPKINSPSKPENKQPEYAKNQNKTEQNLPETLENSAQNAPNKTPQNGKTEKQMTDKLPQVIENQEVKNQVVKNKNMDKLNDKKNRQLLPNTRDNEVPKNDVIENKIIKKQNSEENIAKNDKSPNSEPTTFKVVVTAKFNSNKASNTSETALADNSAKKKGVRGVIQSIREVKNGDKELKLFGMERDKLMASIGRGE